MATYFIDPYKKYYDKLSSSASIVNESKSLVQNINISTNQIDNLKNGLASSSWKEQGFSSLINYSLPGLAANISTIESSVNDGLVVACSLAINSLLPIVNDLKREDENYEALKVERDSLKPVARYDSNGNETSEYKSYIAIKEDLETKIRESSKKCLEYQKNANDIKERIIALNNNAIKVQEKTSQQSSQLFGQGLTILPDSSTGNLLIASYNNSDFYVVNTKIPVVDYSNYVQKNRMYQNAGALNGQCMIASQIYARDMLRGTYSSYNDFINQRGSPATRINERVRSQDKNEVLSYVFDEVNQGHPVVLQVTQKKSNLGLRHLVTVVGFNKNVTSINDLTPENILVLDNVDGKIQTLAERNRNLFNQGGKGYYALGPTDTFLAKEVLGISANA